MGQTQAQLPPELVDQPVMEVEVSGESAVITGADDIGIRPGTTLSRDLVRKTVRRLLETGRWTDVQIDGVAVPGGAKLIVHLRPRIQLSRISVNGQDNLDEQRVREVLRVGKGSHVAEQDLETLKGRVAKLYASSGYLGAQVDLSLRETDDPSRKVLMVKIVEGEPTRLGSIRFSGEVPPDADAVRKAMGIGTQEVLDRRQLEEAVERGERFLRGAGYYEARMAAPLTTIERGSATVTLQTHAGPRYALVVRGAWPLGPADVSGVMSLVDAGLTRAAVRHTLPDRIKDLYVRHGFGKPRVSVRSVKGNKPSRRTLLVQINPGKQSRVVAVSFVGARQFSREFLRDQLFSYLEEDLPNSGLIRPVDSDTASTLQSAKGGGARRQTPRPLQNRARETFYEPTYKEAIAHITELYQAEGFLEARVGPATLQRVGEQRAAVTIPVSEGPRTLLHEVVVKGNQVVSPRELLEASGLERHAPFSYVKLEEARIRMIEHYHERGHMFVKLGPSVRFSNDRTRAMVTIEVVERFPVRVGEVVVRGAERTNEGFIKALLDLEPGDLYRPSRARTSEEELQALGVFTGVSVRMMDAELPARIKPVLVTVNERRNQYLDASAGISTGQGARAGFEYGYRNLLGVAVGTSLRVQLAYKFFFIEDQIQERYEALLLGDRLERQISLGTVIPRIPGLGRVRTNIDLSHVRDNERDFGLDKWGSSLTFTYTGIRRVALTLGGDLENNNVDLFEGEALNDYLSSVDSPRIKRLLRVPEGSSTLVAMRLGASYDRRDSPFVPTKGFFFSAGTELARTIDSELIDTGDGETTRFTSRFVKLTGTVSGYVPIFSRVVLAGQVRIGGIVEPFGESDTYPNRAFFLGGVDTMRGYFEDAMVPQDKANEVIEDPNLDPNTIVRSGDAFMLVRAELRFPIFGQLRGGLFTDVGNLWADPELLNPLELRWNGGVGLRLSTPVGPIALDYGIVFERRRALGEPFGTLHFSIGLF